ncbi:uncharacterized protein LOC135841395 [Planococcus citri]|uniref:uncharacterized protein LOC135841395 n=1 Tax=Planococcus citri TaxID=170843 RepID=UPI0031F8CF59
MLSKQYHFLIWLYIPLVVYSQYETDQYVTEITTEPILQTSAEFEISLFPSNNDENKSTVCNYTNTCEENNSVKQNFADLPSRICMCDEKCSIYGDCCSDVEYRNENRSNFACERTFFDGNIYMRNTCQFGNNDNLSNFCTDYAIIDNKNVFGMIPVTSKTTNITYVNFFCALCNDDKYFRFWEVAIIPNTRLLAINFNVDNEIFLNNNFVEGNMENYTFRAKIPESLSSAVRYCIPDNIRNCLQNYRTEIKCDCFDSLVGKYDFSDSTYGKHVPTKKAKDIPFQFCEIIPTNNSAFKKFCTKNSQMQSIDEPDHDLPELTYIDRCFFQTLPPDSKLCLINSFFQSNEFQIIDSETIYVYEFQSNFSSSEWSLESDSSLYVCGTEIPQSSTQRFFSIVNSFLSNVLLTVSVFFLALYIIMYNNVSKLRYPFSRVILCYSVTLLVACLIFLTANWVSSCKVMAALLHYLFLSCFTWLMVASFECWRTVTSSTRIRNNKEHSWIRFSIYCIIGWILPTSIVSVAIYFELSPIQSIPCTLKPGYGRLNQCFIAQSLPSYYFFHYPSAIMFLVNIYFFIHISVYVFCNSSVHRNFSIFAKLALVTGIPWTIGTLVTLTDAQILRLIYVILNSSQGIFIFFVFAYDKEMIKDIVGKFYHHIFKNAKTRGNSAVTFQATTGIQVSRSSPNEYF